MNSDKIDQFQMCINSLKISKCVLEENLSRICKNQVVKNQTEGLINKIG